MKKILKKPSDYSQFSFRISEEAKYLLDQSLEEILTIQKMNKKAEEPVPKKNELILKALEIGLASISKELNL